MDYPKKDKYNAADLEQIIRILRDPEKGCPWDKVQTHQSIRKNFVEETYEALEAIDKEDPHLLQEELGDVMMQVMLHSQMEAEQGHFTFAQICDGVCRKLIDRHPHIFRGDTGIKDWDTLKNIEKGRVTLQDDLESVPLALPALMRAAKLQKRAAHGGVEVQADADTVAEAARKAQTDNEADRQAAVGQMLFAAVALARRLGVDPEQALQYQNAQFTAHPTSCQEAEPPHSC